jgi:cytochrome P450
VFREPVEDLLQALSSCDGVVDLQPLFFRLILDVKTAFLFGESVRSLTETATSDQANFANVFNVAQDFVAKRMRLQDLYWLVGGRDFRKACKTVHDFADNIIQRGLSRDTAKDEARDSYVFLEFLAQNCSNRTSLRSQIINILIARRDTTAYLISWSMLVTRRTTRGRDYRSMSRFLLVRHPETMHKLQNEIESCIGDQDRICGSDLKQMNYLQSILNESKSAFFLLSESWSNFLNYAQPFDSILPYLSTLERLSEILSFRLVAAQISTGLSLFPKGTAAAYSVYSMHRRPDLYGMDAELFRPERWDEHMPLHDDPQTQSGVTYPSMGGHALAWEWILV